MADEHVHDIEQDAILAALRPVVDGIAATFGPVCEVVLHDYRQPEKSVVAVAGEVTGRAVGGAMSEIGMKVLARGDEAADDLNYVTRTGTGKLVKSSTMVLRDSTGAVFGALCVNVDISAVNEAHTLLGATDEDASQRRREDPETHQARAQVREPRGELRAREGRVVVAERRAPQRVHHALEGAVVRELLPAEAAGGHVGFHAPGRGGFRLTGGDAQEVRLDRAAQGMLRAHDRDSISSGR